MLSKRILLFILLFTKQFVYAQTKIVLPQNKFAYCQKVQVRNKKKNTISLNIGCGKQKKELKKRYYLLISKDDFSIENIRKKITKITIQDRSYSGSIQFVDALDFDEYIYEITIKNSIVTHIEKIYNKFRQEGFSSSGIERNLHFVEIEEELIKNHLTQSYYTLNENQLALLDEIERAYLKKLILALKGYVFEDSLWLKHFEGKEWYTKAEENTNIKWDVTDSCNLKLLDCFEKLLEIPTNSAGFNLESLLNGCWQTGGTTVGAGYADLFRFDSKRKTYNYQTNNEGPEEKTELAHKGIFQIINNQLELLVYEKELAFIYIKKPEPRGLDKNDTIRTKMLPIILPEKKREKRTFKLSSMFFINTPDGLEKTFLKIGNTVYWQIAKEVVDCPF